MSSILSNPVAWYLSITILGWLAFPITYRLLPGLKDRGYASSRALGWLLWGYLFWLLASLGVVRNDVAGLLFAAVLLAAFSLWALRGANLVEMGEWLRRQLGAVLVIEALFLAAFVAWGIVRAANPEALGTEKPMELAFINAILRSPSFPPHDPWLSGYAISYYYFGYVLVAMLAKITGTPGAVAFNLGVVTVFSLGAIGAYGLVYNLLNSRRQAEPENVTTGSQLSHSTLAALLGPLFLLLMSNLQGFLQVLHDRGIFWSRDQQGQWVSSFWSWLDIKDLVEAPQQPFTWVPERYYWWWRASRVLQDYDLAGNSKEIIDEFPFFSFLLSDLHPHVLAIPFGLLAIGLALNLFLGGTYPGNPPARRWPVRISAHRLAGLAWVLGLPGILLIGVGLWKLRLSFVLLGLLLSATAGGAYLLGDARRNSEQPWLEWSLPLHPALFTLAALALGGMAFMNTWDFPVYVGLAAAAFALRDAWPRGKSPGSILAEFFGLGMALGISGIVFYLPFYLGFSSQAGGIVPNLIYATRGAHLWVMFGTLLVPVFAFLAYQIWREGNRRRLRRGLLAGAGITLVLWLLSLALGMLVANLPDSAFSGVSGMFLGSLAAPNSQALFLGAIARRLTQPGGWATLLALLGLSLAGLCGAWDRSGEESSLEDEATQSNGPRFGLLLAIFGTLLVLVPEFFFLRDMFGWRMNTIFKFYYQAWLLWSALAAYATIELVRRLPRGPGTLFGLLMILLVAAGLVYPPLSLWNKTGGFDPPEWNLDSTAYFARQNPAEMAAIDWLKEAPLGVVAEAGMGDAYSEYGRVATFSGQPGVLGWINHENQWRGEGSGTAIGSRQNDLERLYCTRNWDEARSVLERYTIRYVYIGSLERLNYQPQKTIACPLGLVENKFQRNLKAVFDMGGVMIYEYTGNGND